ncbi:MAG TPA: glycosyltransferase family 2 protein [Flavitalea sp.]|nr:glycosyltransferase family 2 protein [Flavitalea sp.]
MNEQPLVSVLMTAYNREKYIAPAIESVLSSTYRNFELIIVDDVSSDNTLQIARSYADGDPRIRVYKNENNLGDYPNRNKAASYATGKYIKYLDADDIIYYYGLSVMVDYLERFPQAGFALAAVVSNEKPFPICLEPRETYLENFQGYNHFDRAPSSSIIKRDAFNKIGGFSGARMIGDYELWFRLARTFPMVKMPFDLYWNRVHEDQESRTEYAKQYPMLRNQVLTAALDHPECPLSEAELKMVKMTLKSKNRKFKLMEVLSKMNNRLKKQNQLLC